MKARLEQDLREAMKARDDARRDTVRFALAAIQNESVAKRGELDDAAIEAVLRKQTKMRRESIEAFTKGGRAELAAKEAKELAILESYLPKQLDEAAVRAAALRAIADTGATGPREQGKVMQKLMPELKGQADGGMVSRVVSELLKTGA
ncbi:MAG TPA: GatB/YqeY domain-containing protein [Candidatus Limnocylindria bacterium]|nr:GatB/YqeY domain-containing protein [Candidatus Limnocylindria bacterium]